MGASEVAAFLTHLGRDNLVQTRKLQLQHDPVQERQRRLGLILHRWRNAPIHRQWPRDQRRLPVVLTPCEVRTLLLEMSGTTGLVATLLYGAGMRLLESLRLRVKDVGFERREILGARWQGSPYFPRT